MVFLEENQQVLLKDGSRGQIVYINYYGEHQMISAHKMGVLMVDLKKIDYIFPKANLWDLFLADYTDIYDCDEEVSEEEYQQFKRIYEFNRNYCEFLGWFLSSLLVSFMFFKGIVLGFMVTLSFSMSCIHLVALMQQQWRLCSLWRNLFSPKTPEDLENVEIFRKRMVDLMDQDRGLHYLLALRLI